MSNDTPIANATETAQVEAPTDIKADQPEVSEVVGTEDAAVENPNTLLDIDLTTPDKTQAETDNTTIENRPNDWPEDLWDKEKGVAKYDDTLKRLNTAEKRAEDLRKILSTKSEKNNKTDTPEEYSFEDLPGGLTGESPEIRHFSKAAKVIGLNNNDANKLLGEYFNSTLQEIDAKRSSEKEKLGPDFEDFLTNLSQFGQTRLDNRTFSTEELNTYKEMVSSASAARVMSKIVEMTGEQPIPTSVRAISDVSSLKDVKDNMEAALMISDPTKSRKAMDVAREQMAQYEARGGRR